MRRSWLRLVSASLRQEFLLALWHTLRQSISLIPYEYKFVPGKPKEQAAMTKVVAHVDWEWGREESREWALLSSYQPSCRLGSVSCCSWWNGSLGDFTLHGWPAGMCFCLGSDSPGPHLRREGPPQMFVLYQASNSLASVGLCCLLDHLLH